MKKSIIKKILAQRKLSQNGKRKKSESEVSNGRKNLGAIDFKKGWMLPKRKKEKRNKEIMERKKQTKKERMNERKRKRKKKKRKGKGKKKRKSMIIRGQRYILLPVDDV